MRSRRSLKLSHTQTSVPCGTLNKSSYSARKMLLDLLGKKSTSLYIAIFMNDLAIEIKNVGLGIRVGDHDPFHTSIMHKIKTKQVTGLLVAVEKVA